jgi:hypothetical protein
MMDWEIKTKDELARLASTPAPEQLRAQVELLKAETQGAPRPIPVGTVRPNRDRISKWRVWNGIRWVRCFTTKGATLLSRELKEEQSLV